MWVAHNLHGMPPLALRQSRCWIIDLAWVRPWRSERGFLWVSKRRHWRQSGLSDLIPRGAAGWQRCVNGICRKAAAPKR